jgi:hypothetical protein
VFATFQCKVSLVNEIIKEKLSRELYLKFKASGRQSDHIESLLDRNDDVDLLDMEPLAAGRELSLGFISEVKI